MSNRQKAIIITSVVMILLLCGLLLFIVISDAGKRDDGNEKTDNNESTEKIVSKDEEVDKNTDSINDGSENPGKDNSETDNPETETTVTDETGTDTPGTDNPGTDTPGTETPGTDNPGTDNPGTDDPGTDNPGIDNPGTDNPGTDNPGTDNPGTDAHGTDTPDTDNPGTDNPGTDTPGTETPGTDDPGTDNPGTDDPGTDTPGTDNPGTDTPGTDDPGTDNPGTDDPGTDNPGTDTPGTDNPGTDDLGTDNPGTDDPGTDNPGTDIPGDGDEIDKETFIELEGGGILYGNGEGRLICIDPGHQTKGNYETEPIGPDSSEKKPKVSSGTCGVETRLDEYKLNLIVSLQLKDELLERGYRVLMTRNINDVNISNIERATIANENNAEIFVRIHANAADDRSVKGIETICPTKGNKFISYLYKDCRLLSDCLLDHIASITGGKKRHVWETDTMSGINWALMPVSIVEMGYMTNKEEDLLLSDPDYQRKIVLGIADGIDEFFELMSDPE